MQKGFGVVNVHGTASGVIAMPVIGENGNWYLGNEDTGVCAVGTNGITPHIGENGNWFLGDMDTQVKAQGEDGLRGPQGIPGPQGPKGDGLTIDSSVVTSTRLTISTLRQNVNIPFSLIIKEGLAHLDNGAAVIDVSGWYLLANATGTSEITGKQNNHDCQLRINDVPFLASICSNPKIGVDYYNQYNMSDMTYLNQGDRLTNTIFVYEAVKVESSIRLTRFC